MFFGDLLISSYMLVALNAPSVFPLRNSAIAEPQVAAQSALIFDIKRGRVLFEKASDRIMPPASLTKLLSSMVVLDSIPLDKVITLDQKAIDTLGDAGDFQIGEKVEARHLLFSALIQSSNDAMMALAYDLGLENFLSLARSKLIQLGLKETSISDPSGLSSQTKSSAREFVKIARAAFQNDFITQILAIPEYSFRSFSGQYHKLLSTNNLIFDSRIIAAKTGFLNEVGQNYAALVSVEGMKDGRALIVIMGSTDRTRDAKVLLNWLEKGFVWK